MLKETYDAAVQKEGFWLPCDKATLDALRVNSDLTVFDFLDGASMGTTARERFEPGTDLVKRQLRLCCVTMHALRCGLAADGNDASAEAILAAVAPLKQSQQQQQQQQQQQEEGLMAVASGVSDETIPDWGAAIEALGPAETGQQAVHEAVLLSLVKVAATFKCFPTLGSLDDLVVPLGALTLLATLPIHVVSTLQADATGPNGVVTVGVIARVSAAIRWLVVVPSLLLQCWAKVLPSKKAKSAKHEAVISLRAAATAALKTCVGSAGASVLVVISTDAHTSKQLWADAIGVDECFDGGGLAGTLLQILEAVALGPPKILALSGEDASIPTLRTGAGATCGNPFCPPCPHSYGSRPLLMCACAARSPWAVAVAAEDVRKGWQASAAALTAVAVPHQAILAKLKF